MVKEEEIMAEADGRGGYMDLLGLGEDDDYLLCLSPSSYFTSSAVSTTTTSATTTAAAAAASSPSCASYLDLAPAYHHMLNFAGQEQYHGGGVLGFQCYGGDHAIPAAVPQKSSPTTECSSSISSMSSSPPATAISAVSCSKPQAFKKKGSRSSEQRKAAAAAAGATTTNKRPRVRRERLGERIIALQQLVSPFGKVKRQTLQAFADTAFTRFLYSCLYLPFGVSLLERTQTAKLTASLSPAVKLKHQRKQNRMLNAPHPLSHYYSEPAKESGQTDMYMYRCTSSLHGVSCFVLQCSGAGRLGVAKAAVNYGLTLLSFFFDLLTDGLNCMDPAGPALLLRCCQSDTASVLHEALGYIRFLHDQVQVLSSPYMQRQPASAHVPAQESAAGTVVEPPRASDLRSRGLCLVPVSCTEHLAGNSHGNGADLWSVAAGMGTGIAKAEAAAADNKGLAVAGGMLLPGGGGGGGHPRKGHLA